jgi:hypothetical protein
MDVDGVYMVSASLSTMPLLAKLLQLPPSMIMRHDRSLMTHIVSLCLKQCVLLILLHFLHLCTKHTLHN